MYIYKVEGYDLCNVIHIAKAISTDLAEILACFGSFEQEENQHSTALKLQRNVITGRTYSDKEPFWCRQLLKNVQEDPCSISFIKVNRYKAA